MGSQLQHNIVCKVSCAHKKLSLQGFHKSVSGDLFTVTAHDSILPSMCFVVCHHLNFYVSVHACVLRGVNTH